MNSPQHNITNVMRTGVALQIDSDIMRHVVRIRMDRPVHEMAITPDQARRIAEALNRHADKMEQRESQQKGQA